jgi:hypothetical protein
MNHSTRKPTVAEQARLDAIHAMPCLCCEIEGVSQPSRTEANHLVDRGSRKLSGGHMATIPLCGYHHRGIPLPGLSADDMLFDYGPSLALHKRTFVVTYGSERELLEKVNERLSDPALTPLPL